MTHQHLSLQSLHSLKSNAHNDDDGSAADGQAVDAGSQVTNIKATTYNNYINQYTARDTAGKGYGKLSSKHWPNK